MNGDKSPVENTSKKLNPYFYAIWDRVFMHYGSTMNSLQHIITAENYLEISQNVWKSSQSEVESFIKSLYDRDEIPTIKNGDEAL